MRKPRVSDVNKWNWTYWYNAYDPMAIVEVSVGEADNYPDFYKVIISKSSFDFGFTTVSESYKPKYFYGEMAWADVNRYVRDETGWYAFDLADKGLLA